MDGFGDPSSLLVSCEQRPNDVSDDTDGADLHDMAHPGATACRDNQDNDCDGDVDDADSSPDLSWVPLSYQDGDEDGFGDRSSALHVCALPSGDTDNDEACDDGHVSVYPGAEERCDGLDNNCDSRVEDGLLGLKALCPGLPCNELYTEGPDDGDSLYWIAPDGDGPDAFEAYCDMTRDGGSWTRVFASRDPTSWSDTDVEDVVDLEDDEYSMQSWRSDSQDAAGVLTPHMGMVIDARADKTIWAQAHDSFDDASSGSSDA